MSGDWVQEYKASAETSLAITRSRFAPPAFTLSADQMDRQSHRVIRLAEEIERLRKVMGLGENREEEDAGL